MAHPRAAGAAVGIPLPGQRTAERTPRARRNHLPAGCFCVDTCGERRLQRTLGPDTEEEGGILSSVVSRTCASRTESPADYAATVRMHHLSAPTDFRAIRGRPCPAQVWPRVWCGLPRRSSSMPRLDSSTLQPAARGARTRWPGLRMTSACAKDPYASAVTLSPCHPFTPSPPPGLTLPRPRPTFGAVSEARRRAPDPPRTSRRRADDAAGRRLHSRSACRPPER